MTLNCEYLKYLPSNSIFGDVLGDSDGWDSVQGAFPIAAEATLDFVTSAKMGKEITFLKIAWSH